MAPTRFSFAWVDATETTFGPEHIREDELVASAAVDHAEGDFATLQVVIRNPRIGLLAPARKTWAWLGWGGEPLFLGRLIGIPNDINLEACTLQFVARPVDYADQKEQVAASLRTFPYYDPVFITPDAQADPDTVLEARPALWHIDRTTLEVSVSNVLVGEDGLEEFLESDVPYDSVQINVGQVPVRNLDITGSVSWTQAASGAMAIFSGGFETYSGKSLLDDWPKPGDNLGGGWTATAAFARDNYNVDGTETTSTSVSWSNDAAEHSSGDTLSISISSTIAPLRGPSIEIPLTSGDKSGGDEASIASTSLRVPLWSITAFLAAQYDAQRSRKETVQFRISANFQPLLTLPGDEEAQILSVSGGDVALPTPVPGAEYADTELPLVDARRRSYFTTDRGLRSLEYLILRGRSVLLMASRAVQITFQCRFERAVQLSCRKNATIHDHRLPGGQATGKIVRYNFTVDGDSGSLIGEVTIGCAIGYGGTVVPVGGTPTYVEEGYVDLGYQVYEGQTVVLDAGDVGYSVPVDDVNDDGVTFPLTPRQAILVNQTHGSAAAQRVAIEGLAKPPEVGFSGPQGTQEQINEIVNRGTVVPKQIDDYLKANSVWQEIRLRNVQNGPFESAYAVELTLLEIPKGIDLEAPSSP